MTDLNIIVSELGKKEITEDEFNILTDLIEKTGDLEEWKDYKIEIEE